jgi:hypothetical protein
MKILVATKEGQGVRKNDFSHAEENEPVQFAFRCDGETVDGPCGCARSMGGMNTHKATTTFKAAEVDIAPEAYLDLFVKFYVEGWHQTPEEALKMAKDETEELLRLAAYFPEGRVLERRGNKVQTRSMKPKREPRLVGGQVLGARAAS